MYLGSNPFFSSSSFFTLWPWHVQQLWENIKKRVFLYPHSPISGRDVGQGRNLGPGEFGKHNELRALNIKSRGPILHVTSSETRSVCVKQALNTRR